MSGLRMKVLVGGGGLCSSGPCPTVYLGDDGRFYVQGFKVAAPVRAAAAVPATEEVVEVPRALLEELRKLSSLG